MAKTKISKGGAPSIDMTPMVDLAFLLVTFFMLSSTFRTDEPVEVTLPNSTSDKLIPEEIIQITIDKEGLFYFNVNGFETRKNVLNRMSAEYKVGFSDDQKTAFSYMTSFGCSINDLPAYIQANGEEKKNFPRKGIPADSLNNQLKNWINFANAESLISGKARMEDEISKGNEVNKEDFKPKFILKVDGDADYKKAQVVINVFRDLNINNLNFVTSLVAVDK